MAEGPPGVPVRTVEPVLSPVKASGLVTEPCDLMMSTGGTSSFTGPGTRLCQSGLAGHVGKSSAAFARGGDAATVSAIIAPTRAMDIDRRRLVTTGCAHDA